MRSEVSVTDSNSLMSDGRVHIVYKYVEGISRSKQKSKKPLPPAWRAEDGGALRTHGDLLFAKLLSAM